MIAKKLILGSFAVLSLISSLSQASCITDEEARKLLPTFQAPPDLCGAKKSGRTFKVNCSCTASPSRVESSPYSDGLFYTYCVNDLTAVDQNADSFTYYIGYEVTCDGTVKSSKYAE